MSYTLKRIGVVVLIIGGAVGVMSWMGTLAAPPAKKPPEINAPLVEVLQLVPETVQFDVDSQGTVLPLTETELAAEVSGAIVSMSDAFVAGGRFVAGEVLMRIDPTNYEVAVERAEAAVSQRQVEYDGARKLRENGYRSEAELLSAKAQLSAARADLVRAQRDLERTLVRAPYNGLVRTRAAQLGNYVTPGTRLGTVFATDAAEVRLPLPDNDLAFTELPIVAQDSSAGSPVTLHGQFRGRPASWQARIVRTEGVVDTRNRMVFAVARVEDPYQLNDDEDGELPLPIGTFVTADIEGITVDNVVKIPRALVRGNRQIMFVDAERQLRFRDLDFLRTDADYVYVNAADLTEMEVVATTLEAPLNGMKVRTEIDAAAPAETELALDGDAAVAGAADEEG